MNKEIIKSPFSNEINAIKIEDLDTLEIINRYSKMGININKYISYNSKISIYECPKTKLRFYSPNDIFGDDIFYENLQKVVSDYYPKNKDEFYSALGKISAKDNVLEIGCGDGAFLDLLKEKGISYTGLEFNMDAVNKCVKKKHNVLNKSIETFAVDNIEKFDAVVAFQVLEHVTNLNSFIKAIIKVLKPSGIVIFAVPNSQPYYQNFRIYETMNLPPHHSALWNSNVFSNLQNIFQLKLQEIEYVGDKNIFAFVFYSADLFLRKFFNNKLYKYLQLSFIVLLSPIFALKVFTMNFQNKLNRHCIIATFSKNS